jgi:hypothetical protein
MLTTCEAASQTKGIQQLASQDRAAEGRGKVTAMIHEEKGTVRTELPIHCVWRSETSYGLDLPRVINR